MKKRPKHVGDTHMLSMCICWFVTSVNNIRLYKRVTYCVLCSRNHVPLLCGRLFFNLPRPRPIHCNVFRVLPLNGMWLAQVIKHC